MKNKQKAKFSFGAYLSFFTRFPIPWWLFLLSLLLGFANTEVVLAVSNYLIRINKGELYNGVIIGYTLMNVFNALLSMLINLTGGYGSALVTLRARKLLWRKILHLPMREMERRQPSALISGLVQFLLFPGSALLGASGIVFMMIVLSSLAGMREGEVPLTLVLVVLLYLGGEVVDAATARDSVSQLTHIVGGLCGAGLGFAMGRGRRI